jgi:uncharacterized protein
MDESVWLRTVGKRIGIWVLRRLIVVMVLLTLVVLFLYFRQHSMIYHPRAYGPNYARRAGFDGLEIKYRISAGDETAFYIPARRGLPRRVWLAFCGNGSVALDWTNLFQHYPQDDEGFLLVDYPGYGKSAGYATIGNTRESAEAALEKLSSQLGIKRNELRLCVIGHSLGAAAALDFAEHHPVERIVVIAPFTTLREEAARVVGGLLSRLLTENYDNRSALKKILASDPAPRVTVFHGYNDDVIPERMSEELRSEFPAIRFFPVAGADHVTVLEISRDLIIASMTAGL